MTADLLERLAFPPAYPAFISEDEDSRRWAEFHPRQSDIIIATRARSGTTWTQMICALLIFQTPKLPLPLSELSPWLDWSGEPIGKVVASLDRQKHRRFIKTHTPLEVLPRYAGVTYICVARNPLDAVISNYFHLANVKTSPDLPDLHTWVTDWIDARPGTAAWKQTHSLETTLKHVGAAWNHRGNPQVILLRYEDLLADAEHEMRMLAKRLEIEVPEKTWPRLVRAAEFASMKQHARKNVPIQGWFKSDENFFRRGASGYGREILTEDELNRYQARLREIVSGEGAEKLLAWLCPA
jgi:aryl sulfotransferase